MAAPGVRAAQGKRVDAPSLYAKGRRRDSSDERFKEAPIDEKRMDCPECGESGYPALRPRKGRKWKGSKPEGLARE